MEFSDGRTQEGTVGLDGVPRFWSGGRFGLRLAVQGEWMGKDSFHLVHDEVANINAFTLHLTYHGNEATAMVAERTGLVDQLLLNGHTVPARGGTDSPATQRH